MQDLPIYQDAIIKLLLDQCRLQDLSDARIAIAGAQARRLADAIRKQKSEAGSEVLIVSLPGQDLSSASDRFEAGQPIEEIDDEDLDCVFWADARPLTAEALKAVHAKLQMNGTIGLIRNQGAYNGSDMSDTASALEKTWAHDLSESSKAVVDSKTWLAVFDEQVKGDPVEIATVAEPLFSLPLGREVAEWETEIPLTKSWAWIQKSFEAGNVEDLRQQWEKAVQGVTDETTTMHGQTLAVWTSKIPA